MISPVRLGTTLLVLAAIAGCAQPPYVPSDIEGPPLPEDVYRQGARDGATVYRIDPQRSRIFVRVGRDGPMRSAGHDHVIASEDVDGLVLLGDELTRARTDLRVPLQKLVVDKAEYRERFGLETGISASAINGTTRNMQDKVLESGLYPFAVISARFADPREENSDLAVSVSLHDSSFEYVVPVRIQTDANQLSVAGTMTMQHGDFGLSPYSAVGGLLRVAEQIDVEFELLAQRIELRP